MMYREYKICIKENNSALDESDVFDLLISMLGDYGFESFSVENSLLDAYIEKGKSIELDLSGVFASFPIEGLKFSCAYKEVEEVDWNEEWEKNYFSPQIFANGRCVVRAPFHNSFPDSEIELIISPKMAFGTGNHQTTSLIIDYLMNSDLSGKRVLDMGCGTGILGLLAMKLGAKSLVSVDIDKWAYDNVREHAVLNNVYVEKIIHGDAFSIKGAGPFDLILANITRNILLDDMDNYVSEMSNNSTLVLSGFYDKDVQCLREKAESLSLTYGSRLLRDNWALLEMTKNN